jgi:hypothetical protein
LLSRLLACAWHGQRYGQCFAVPIADRLGRFAQMGRMMMAVHAVQHLNAHARKAGGFPFVDASLHQPRRACVSQLVRRHAAVQACQSHGGPALSARLGRPRQSYACQHRSGWRHMFAGITFGCTTRSQCSR